MAGLGISVELAAMGSSGSLLVGSAADLNAGGDRAALTPVIVPRTRWEFGVATFLVRPRTTLYRAIFELSDTLGLPVVHRSSVGREYAVPAGWMRARYPTFPFGTHVLKALALGANACSIGQPYPDANSEGSDATAGGSSDEGAEEEDSGDDSGKEAAGVGLGQSRNRITTLPKRLSPRLMARS